MEPVGYQQEIFIRIFQLDCNDNKNFAPNLNLNDLGDQQSTVLVKVG